MRKLRKWLAVLGIGACLLSTAPMLTAYAETEPTYEITEETANVEAQVGVVTAKALNVRTGFGANYDRLVVNEKNVTVHEGDRLAIMSAGTAGDGSTWYEVRWIEDGIHYHGYVSGGFLKPTEELAVPLPTPTPEATPTPEPTPTPEVTPTPEPTPTPVATPSPSPTPVPEKEGFSPLKGAGLVALLLILAILVYMIFMKKKREATVAETTEKIDNLKNIQIKKGPEDANGNPISIMKRKQEIPPEVFEEASVKASARSYESDADLLARKEHARMVNAEIMEKSRFYDPSEEKKKEDELRQLSESLKEKELLREEIENLSPGDMVYHEYFGKGVVFDNSDVKRIEIRFGTDVRFVDKAGCVAKKLMRKV